MSNDEEMRIMMYTQRMFKVSKPKISPQDLKIYGMSPDEFKEEYMYQKNRKVETDPTLKTEDDLMSVTKKHVEKIPCCAKLK